MSAWNFTDPKDVEDYVLYIAPRENISVNLFLGIVRYESNFILTAKNPVGTASGVMQFLDSTFKGFCIDKYHMTDTMENKNHVAIQMNCAAEMLRERNGYKHWCASYENWIKSIPLEEKKEYNCA